MKTKILVFLWTLMALGLGLVAHARADVPDAAPVVVLADLAPTSAPVDPVPVPADIGAAVVAVGDAYEALRTGHMRVGVALLLVLIVAALRQFAGRAVPWLRTDRGGAALVLACALLLELAAVLQLGAPIGVGVLLTALQSGLTAAGGWIVVRRLIWPPDQVVLA